MYNKIIDQVKEVLEEESKFREEMEIVIEQDGFTKSINKKIRDHFKETDDKLNNLLKMMGININ